MLISQVKTKKFDERNRFIHESKICKIWWRRGCTYIIHYTFNIEKSVDFALQAEYCVLERKQKREGQRTESVSNKGTKKMKGLKPFRTTARAFKASIRRLFPVNHSFVKQNPAKWEKTVQCCVESGSWFLCLCFSPVVFCNVRKRKCWEETDVRSRDKIKRHLTLNTLKWGWTGN